MAAGATLEVPKHGEPRRHRLRQQLVQPTLAAVTTAKVNRTSVFLMIVYSTEGATIFGDVGGLVVSRGGEMRSDEGSEWVSQ